MSSRLEKKSEKVFHKLFLTNLSRIKKSLKKFFSDYLLADFYYIVRLVRIQKTQIKRSKCC